MSPRVLKSFTPGDLTPAAIWSQLPLEARTLAARALYANDPGDSDSRRDADMAIAAALRFRDVAVRRMPVEKRIAYLIRAVRPDESLASSLLLALHLGYRRPMLSAFLDALEIPHREGLIAEDHSLGDPDPDALARAAGILYERFPEAEVEIYLASLVAIDPDHWGPLARVVASRDGS